MSRIRHVGGAVTAVRVLDVFSELSRLESRVRNSMAVEWQSVRRPSAQCGGAAARRCKQLLQGPVQGGAVALPGGAVALPHCGR